MSAKSQSILPEVITGLFVAAVIALLAFFTIVISGVDLLRGRHRSVREARFAHVGALKVQDPVHVRGMKVGSVQELRLGDGCVIATLTLDADVPLRADATVSVAQTSVLGGTCLEIEQGVAPEPLPPDAILPGAPARDVMKELGELVGDLRQAIEPSDVRALLTNLRGASEDIADLTGRLRRGDGLLGKIMSPEDNTYADLKEALANIKGLTGDLRLVAQDLRGGKGLLGKLLREEDTTYDDLKGVLANLKDATANLNNPKTTLGRLLTQDSSLIADLEAVASNLREVSVKLNEGQGTIGHLVNDDTLAKDAEAAVRDVRQIIDNMRDTAPITTFTSLFFSGL